MRFQVGVAYKHKEDGHMFLAVSPSELLTFSNNKPRTITPYFHDRYAICARASVNSLLTLWGISARQLDESVASLIWRDFTPTQIVPNTKERTVAQEMELGNALRAVPRLLRNAWA